MSVRIEPLLGSISYGGSELGLRKVYGLSYGILLEGKGPKQVISVKGLRSDRLF